MIFAITFSIDFDMVPYESYIQPRTFVVRMHGAALFSQSDFCCGPIIVWVKNTIARTFFLLHGLSFVGRSIVLH